MESLVQVTRVSIQAKITIAMVSCAAASTVDVGKKGEARSFITRESVPIPSEVHLIGMERCLKILKDSFPLEVKEEAQGRPINEGL